MSDIAVFLGQQIRTVRKEHKMSQEELAYLASISPAHLGQIERAVKNPTLDTINQIASALNLSVSELLSPYSRSASGVPPKKPAIEKILSHLNQMSDDELSDILKMIRIFEHYKK